MKVFEGLTLVDGETVHDKTIDEQTRLDTMQRVFQQLPAPELQKYNLDLENRAVPGSEMAVRFQRAWLERQKELRSLQDLLDKPAESMSALVSVMRNASSLPTDTVAKAIADLQTYLEDVDNARDFHTIGGWPVLLSFLKPHRTLKERELAAWAVGSAVKADPEYQHWVLEKDNATSTHSGLEDLVSMLRVPVSSRDDVTIQEAVKHMHRKSLHAIAAASRGQVDVQAVLRDMQLDRNGSIGFTDVLRSHAAAHLTVNAPLSLKVWNYVSDMLEEREFLCTTMIERPRDEQTVAAERAAMEVMQYTDAFCSLEWMRLRSIAESQVSDKAAQPQDQHRSGTSDRLTVEAVQRALEEVNQYHDGNCRTVITACTAQS